MGSDSEQHGESLETRNVVDLEFLYPGGQYVKVMFEHAEGEGLYVLHAIKQLQESHHIAQVIQALRGDAGIQQALEYFYHQRQEEDEDDEV